MHARKQPLTRSVYYRCADGQGTKSWGNGYASDTDAINARDDCYHLTTDATMVWATRSDQNGTVGAVLTRDP